MWLASYISQYTYTKKCHETPNRLLPKIWSYSVDIIDQLRDYERPDNHGKSYLKSFISRSMNWATPGLCVSPFLAKMNSKYYNIARPFIKQVKGLGGIEPMDLETEYDVK